MPKNARHRKKEAVRVVIPVQARLIPRRPVCLAFFLQRMAATGGPAEGFEDGFGPVHLDLADEFQEFAESAFGKAFLLEPEEVFHGEIVEGHTVGRVGLRAKFPKGHVHAADFRHGGGDVPLQAFERFFRGGGIAHGKCLLPHVDREPWNLSLEGCGTGGGDHGLPGIDFAQLGE